MAKAKEDVIITETTEETANGSAAPAPAPVPAPAMTGAVPNNGSPVPAPAPAPSPASDLTEGEVIELAAEASLQPLEETLSEAQIAASPNPAAAAMIEQIDQAVITNLESSSQNLRRSNLDARTSEVLTRIYMTKRIQYQMQWYKSRMIENDYNDGTMFKAAAWVMSISSVLAMGGAVSDSALLPMLTALLPPVAALIASFRSLYQWDKQNSVYHDTVLGLEEAKLILPDFDEVDVNIAFTVYPQLVRNAEAAFDKEAQQWGQIAAGKTETDGANMDAVERFANEFGLTILDDEGYINEEKIAEIRAILQASEQPSKAQRRPADSASTTNTALPVQPTAYTPPADELG